MLYLAFGDGGKANDHLRLAQNPFLFNGKILRIDVNTRTGDREYGIPEDNPFTGKAVLDEGWRPEIWALGLRNPWGLWFDPADDRLWCADVGQNLWEEINIIERGGNYGWSHKEGFADFATRTDKAPEGAKFLDPIHAYDHTVGLSITGGYVYRGGNLKDLADHYLFGDFVKGTVMALPANATRDTQAKMLYQRTDPKGSFKVSGLSPDSDGEPLVFSWDGKVYEISGSK